MRLMVNGTERSLPGEPTLGELVESLTTATRGVAVAVNGEVVPRTDWPTAALHDGDRVEVLTAAQGG